MPVTGPLSGRAAVVTGSSRGIGAAIAYALAEQGADVVVHGRAPSPHASATVERVASLGARVQALFADLCRAGEAERLIVEAGRFGAIDILVNNAAIARATPIEELTRADWDEHVATNLTPVFVTMQAVLPGMRARGWGRIINISSTAAQARTVIGPHYAATKAGMLGLTRVYAGLVAADGVTVNAIAPALIETEMIAGTSARPEMLPVGRFGRPDEVAAAAVLLATNGYITGQTINVNGGLYMG
jgi:3-oxoacyl-[acyl-carrier protein] reductase